MCYNKSHWKLLYYLNQGLDLCKTKNQIRYINCCMVYPRKGVIIDFSPIFKLIKANILDNETLQRM